MTNPLKGEVKFHGPDGKPYTFVLGTYAQVVVEEKTGSSWTAFWQRAKEWKTTDLVTLFAAGMARHHDDLGPKELADLIDHLGQQGLAELVNEAIALATPEAAKGGLARPTKTRERAA